MKIRDRFTIELLVSALVPLLLVVFATHFFWKRYTTSSVVESLEAIATIQKHRITAVMDRYREQVLLISSRTQLRISLSDYLRSGNSASLKRVQKILRDAQSSISGIMDIQVVDLGGKFLLDIHNQNDFLETIKPETLNAIGENPELIHVNRQDKGTVLFFAAPLKIDKQKLGFVLVIIDGHAISKIAADYSGLHDSGETIIAKRDRSGNTEFLNPVRFSKGIKPARVIPKSDTHIPITIALSGQEAVVGVNDES